MQLIKLNKIIVSILIANLAMTNTSQAAIKKSSKTQPNKPAKLTQVTEPTSSSQLAAKNTPPEATDAASPIHLVAVGDMMIGSAFPNKDFLPPDDAKHSFDAVLPYLKGDIVMGNLEGSLLDNGESTKCPPTTDNSIVSQTVTDKATNSKKIVEKNIPTPPTKNTQKTSKSTPTKQAALLTKSVTSTDVTTQPPRTCYAFRMPERYGQVIKDAGFNLVSVANNHIGDFGDAGRTSTLKTLDSVGIYSAGLLSKPTTIFSVNGVKYGFVAFAPNIGTVSINDIDNAKQLVKDLNKKVDIVIVSMHGGGEGADNIHVPKTDEMYLNEKRGNVYALAHALIDNGADVVIGHGPHVTRAMELYKNKIIAYSLGNFNTYGAFNLKGPNGYAPILNLNLAKNGDFITAEVTSTKQTKENGLQLDTNNQAFNALKQLTESDFPETLLDFSENKITIKAAPASESKN